MQNEDSNQLDRRRFLGTSLGLAAGASLLSSCGGETGEPAGSSGDVLPDGLDTDDFIVHGTNPWTLETKRGHLQGLITPTDRVFVRGNLPFPDKAVVADRDAWKLDVQGVKNPGTVTLADLKSMGRKSVCSVLQCSGNGRLFFEHGPSGSQWGVGAAANVVWTGVPISTVLNEFGGATSGLPFLTGTGGEAIPSGLEERKVVIERSIPLAKGLEDCLLAWDMNSEPLTISHGGPLRLVVPGYYGVNHVKYVKRLAATLTESDAKIMVSSYRVRPIGEKGAADQPTMWAMNTKSWIDSPLGEAPLQAGRTQITGVTFSGEAEIDSVEVSTDGGKTWKAAEIVGPFLGPYAWRQFAMTWDATPGTHMLASRARDTAGVIQPETHFDNHRGYTNNAWRDHAVSVTVV